MKKRKAYQLVFLRGLKKTKSRFLSIFLIVFIGTSLFAGLRNTPITMQNSMDDYFKSHCFADLTLISTLGFTEDDLSTVANIEGVKTVEGAYRTDVSFASPNINKEYSAILHSKNDDFHDLDILRGRNIENDGECLVDSRLVDDDLLGKTITVKNGSGEVSLEVVGIVNDSRYISDILRGTNTYTQASNDVFIIASESDVKALSIPQELTDLRSDEMLYNEILVAYDIDPSISLYSQEYEDQTKMIQTNISDTMQDRVDQTKENLVQSFEEELVEPRQQYEDGLAEYNKNKAEFTTMVNDAKIQILEGKIEIVNHKKEILEAQSTLNNQTAMLSDEMAGLNAEIEQYQNQINAIPEADISLPEGTLPDTGGEGSSSLPETTIPTEGDLQQGANAIVDQINQEVNSILNEMKSQVNAISEELQTALNGLQTLLDANIQLNNASYELEKASLEVEQKEAELENLEIETNQQLEEAYAQLEDARIQLEEAESQIDAIPDGMLYTLGKDQNAGYVSFESDSQAMDSLSQIFPLMFFLVAALVSLTTMTRMVEEQRQQSGTLRALGYSKKDVMMFYVYYVLLATFFASMLGIIFGTFFFTNLVYYLYTSLMYCVNAPIRVSMTAHIIPLTLFVSVFVILSVTLIVIYQELNSRPAELMRPKPPKLGKRVLLERINFIWKRLSFNQKVTMRNIFRYKKRFFMSVAGIAGCSALIVTGFGLKNSVAQIIPLQFSEVWTYDGSATLDESDSYDEMNTLVQNIESKANIHEELGIYESATNATSTERAEALSVSYRVISERYNPMIHYYDHNKNELSLDDEGVIISQKTAELLGVGVDDTITITIGSNSYDVMISNICENYYSHYIYMSRIFYENLVGEAPEFNQILFTMKDDDASMEESLSNTLRENSNIVSVTFVSSLSDDFSTMIGSIDIVIVIIIVVAALLAFVVLYNLTNINIQERMNEIATIKVLGFYPKEVYDYVFRENVLLSFIGSIIGLFLGVILHQFVIRTVEIDMTMFYRQVNPSSFVFAIVLTALFTFVINRIMRRNLDRIDMVESLKSIE